MMMCRLLCALLVLALCCCCPSVCTSESPEKDDASSTTDGTTRPPSTDERTDAGGNVKSRSPTSESGPRVEVESELPGTGATAGKSENNAPGTLGSTGPEKQSDEVSNARQTKGTNGVIQPQGGTKPSTEQENQVAEFGAATITTTTSKAPTTTTTTAPETTSTTTTEAPTTTTTRAPSRLREVDGSLSGSAWVCAPLLLAASALAYTTPG
ncbi:putative mucin TcMUCII [Trypanosoma cruzi]|uniref:Mucin TcMUCII, putative n=2 Tax=Trypanosoma cruzi TaxID=5693 RepID=Q4DU21_TRYCC|nr:mucin TcMUCII, putative [Trypanosoma cruzi]EAN96025.1 mucin TcMUCII, putative [Trypanosoma cruzi]PWV11128.1 putative mucin TcMUCII [Trypanosoma cruzi]|eukprot:XP_817876.1 mucin TcMUCII [Trypanosoma cruzi strain CL Brener]